MRLINGVVVLLLCRPLLLSAQDPRIAARFPAPVAARLDPIVDSAKQEQLPTDPLVLRALEGQAKGASTDQIVDAMNRLHTALRTARGTLGRDAAIQEITTAAAALQAGMPVSELDQLHRLRGRETIIVPLSAYLDLVARGAAPDRTWNKISALARDRAPDADFSGLTPADVGHDPPPPRPPGGHR